MILRRGQEINKMILEHLPCQEVRKQTNKQTKATELKISDRTSLGHFQIPLHLLASLKDPQTINCI